ncbi:MULTISPECIES: hypothetical protein [unclassified Mesorhizobium]|uniref:hypothetical protein n=1 Tax=unclassified Mesorhizobium TaxID=325217 RepID=UPI001D02C9EE|nr:MULTISPECIES: hypothetical protein [unclassified Mesorhizobium]UCI15173.1 hypothetical protein FJ972_10100 [Mesorhizobium sp. B2-1-1]
MAFEQRLASVLSGAALLSLLGATAFADEAAKLTELSPNGQDACFGRIYDANQPPQGASGAEGGPDLLLLRP